MLQEHRAHSAVVLATTHVVEELIQRKGRLENVHQHSNFSVDERLSFTQEAETISSPDKVPLSSTTPGSYRKMRLDERFSRSTHYPQVFQNFIQTPRGRRSISNSTPKTAYSTIRTAFVLQAGFGPIRRRSSRMSSGYQGILTVTPFPSFITHLQYVLQLSLATRRSGPIQIRCTH